MQDGEKEGCWFMTMGHVFYQEPVRVESQIFYSPDLNTSRLLERMGYEMDAALLFVAAAKKAKTTRCDVRLFCNI
jgi:hypothetical protein